MHTGTISVVFTGKGLGLGFRVSGLGPGVGLGIEGFRFLRSGLGKEDYKLEQGSKP